MKHALEYQQVIDMDWFGVDQNGFIIHVTSCGGDLPPSVVALGEKNFELKEYFLSLKDINTNTMLVKSRESISYSDFFNMAKKGLYSFDKRMPHEPLDPDYYLVASPQEILKFESLPENISDLIKDTTMDASILSRKSFSIDEFD